MPNWNENTLTISDISFLDVEKIKGLIKEEGNEEFLDFDRIIPSPKNENGEPLEDWYDWRIENWGCKWNANSTSIEITPPTQDELGEAVLHFDTPWSPPIPVVKALAIMFPEATIELEYLETGCCFMGTIRLKGEEVLSETYSEELKDLKDKYPDYYEDDEDMPDKILCPKCRKEIDRAIEQRVQEVVSKVLPVGDSFQYEHIEDGSIIKSSFHCPLCDAVIAEDEDDLKAVFLNPLNNAEHSELVDEKIKQDEVESQQQDIKDLE